MYLSDALIGASLILVNGIYFKGLWSRQFKTTDTKKAPFFLGEKDAVDVDMMSQTSKFLYGNFPDVGAHAVALPYKGERLSMIIIAPKEKTGLSRVEEGLKKYTPQAIFDNLYATEKVIVRLPRFKIESTMPLVPTLRKMGLSAMFTGRADFSGIPQDKEQLVVTEVIQKAFIEVNEEGSEAAAATAIRMARCAPPMCDMPTEFNADRPFIFQIVDRQTNFVLFAGRCNNPLQNK
ncbi:Serpin B8 [Folsomia candida]|uniref:Serpin B8 n=1 Tax=Folsomia candida TaxID=158441 RepID=A0A226EHS1_FOLCA|nr:Serpin B8 [Folsomia candida]